MIGGGGSIASTFGTESTSFATGWPIRRPIAKREEDWSTGFAKCITSESSAGAVDEARERPQTGMQPLYRARIEDLGRGDLVKVDCTARHHFELLTPVALLKPGLSPAAKVLDLAMRFGAAGAKREVGRLFRSGGGVRTADLRLS